MHIHPYGTKPDILINKSPIVGTKWKEKGITHLHHLFKNNILLSFQELVQKYIIGKEQYLKYHQIKSALKAKINISNNSLQPPPLMENINTIASSKKPLSKLYKLLSSTDNNIYLPINNWEKDLNINVNTDFWTNICKNTSTISNNTNIQLIQYKINHRVHITQHKMYKMGFTDSDLCTHCTLHTADNYVHAHQSIGSGKKSSLTYHSSWDAASHYPHHCAYLEPHQKSTHPTKTQLQYL